MKSDYQKIKGLGTGDFYLSQLYEGTDHLLLVQGTGFTEEYKRIFYRDIRYIVARKDMTRMLVHACFSGAMLVLLTLLNFTPAPWWILDLCALPFLIWFVVNLLRGETCRCYVNTDVQTVELPVPRRLGRLPVLITLLNTKISPGQAGVEQVLS